MVGLIASATHLGNPSNALYVFTGVGRSPLSTEVFAAVIFLSLAGVFWLYSFAEHPRVGLQRGLLAAIDVAIVAFVLAVAFAYHVDTILTWSLPLVPREPWVERPVRRPAFGARRLCSGKSRVWRGPNGRVADSARRARGGVEGTTGCGARFSEPSRARPRLARFGDDGVRGQRSGVRRSRLPAAGHRKRARLRR